MVGLSMVYTSPARSRSSFRTRNRQMKALEGAARRMWTPSLRFGGRASCSSRHDRDDGHITLECREADLDPLTGDQASRLPKIKGLVCESHEKDWLERLDADRGGDAKRLDDARAAGIEGHVLQSMLALWDGFLEDSDYKNALISDVAVS